MKYPATIILSCLFLVFLIYKAYDTDKQMAAKDAKIKELEFQVWSLKLDRRLDSIKDNALETLHNKMDSLP